MSHLGSTWSSRVCGGGLVLAESYMCPCGVWRRPGVGRVIHVPMGGPPVSVSWDGVKRVKGIFTHNLSYGVNGSAIP